MPASPSTLLDLLVRLINRDSSRTEADIQADVRQLLLTAPFQLDEGDVRSVLLESPLGDRRRIDVELGSTVVEVKRDLRRGRVKSEALQQLAGYVAAKTQETGRRYVGILTDGVDWLCYHHLQQEMREVSAISVKDGKAELDRLVFWLEGVLATAKGIKPSADEITSRLGSGSSAYALDRATLSHLYQLNNKLPTIRLKRTLWSRLLTSALGTQFEDTDDLFIEHTLLVNSAEIIAHAVLGLPVEGLNPASLLSGAKFDESGIYGVVEADFFDWVLEVGSGDEFVRSLTRRLSRFDWSNVDQDVLKVLYESVIGPDTRKRLGEYYTPDWLAAAMVDEVITAPLDNRVLDTACGSGTFLFHAIRNYIAAAERSSIPLPAMLEGVTKHVLGMDLHPVAVTFARVTYLLAIGRDKLTDTSRGVIQVPVYLGDAIQWQEQELDLWSAGNLVVHANDQKELFAAELRFPDSLLENAANFDQLVNALATKASTKKLGAPVPRLSAIYRRLAIPIEAQPTIDATFKTMCRLHDEGRDHIWGYYVRNLARPMWLSRDKNRVDILIGNPPWLAYRHMTPEMQRAFRGMSEARGLWAGSEVATHQDLSALFVVRATELYLKKGGTFAVVMPNAAVDRLQFEGFRTGNYKDKNGAVAVQLAFSESWDLRRIRPHFFPRGSSVVFGERSELPKKMPTDVQIWTGRLDPSENSWAGSKRILKRVASKIRLVNDSVISEYELSFTQGVTLSPRLLFVVIPKTHSPLGLPAGKISVESSRSVYEKAPWRSLPSIEGVVETEFVRPLISGETLLSYRILPHQFAVFPCTAQGLICGSEEIEMYPSLAQWWRRAEEIWTRYRSSDRFSLRDQLDYQSKLTKQLPVPALRVVYNASGMHLCASKLQDRRAIVAKSLYWAAAASHEEADYLCAVLNAPATTELARPYMSYGKDERHFDKHIWQLPIPKFDPTNATHKKLVSLSKILADLAEQFRVDIGLHFAATRRHIREQLEASDAGIELNEIVFELLS